MSTFDERLAAAKNKPRPHSDVLVCLDQDAAAERDELIAAIAAAKQADAADERLAAVETAAPLEAALDALQETMQGALVRLRFVQLPGDKWSDLTWRNLPRAEVELDREYGYNIDAVVRAAAAFEDKEKAPGVRYSFRLEGDEVIPLTDEQIDDLWPTLAGSEMDRIRDAVWGLNDFLPSQRIESLVKGFGAATRSVTK